MIRRPSPFLVLLVLAGWIGSMAGPVEARFRTLDKGMEPPEFSGVDPRDETEVAFEPGKDPGVVVITFWATWSPRSLELLEDLKGFHETYAGHPLRIIAVNVERPRLTGPERERVMEVLAALELPFPIVLDEDLAIFTEFGVIAVPSTAVIGGEGLVQYAPSGYSLTIKDRMVDSTEVLLGIRERAADAVLETVYVPVPSASRYYRLALRMLNEGLLERAGDNLARARAADSLFAAPYVLQGRVDLALGDPAAAVVSFARATELDSEQVQAWTGWGRALLRDGRTDDARVKLERAVEIDDTYTPGLIELADCLRRGADRERVTALLDGAEELNPFEPWIHVVRARLQWDRKTCDAAVDSYRKAFDTLFPSPWAGLDSERTGGGR